MGRAPRVQFPGGTYHVVSRGNLRAPIYLDDDDRHYFLVVLRRICVRHKWTCHAYCLLTNHFHLIVETPDATLSRGMQTLNGTYARSFNERYGRQGHLFENRFWSGVLLDERRLREALRYVAFNPVRAGLCERPAEWRWTGGSAFSAMLGV